MQAAVVIMYLLLVLINSQSFLKLAGKYIIDTSKRATVQIRKDYHQFLFLYPTSLARQNQIISLFHFDQKDACIRVENTL